MPTTTIEFSRKLVIHEPQIEKQLDEGNNIVLRILIDFGPII